MKTLDEVLAESEQLKTNVAALTRERDDTKASLADIEAKVAKLTESNAASAKAGEELTASNAKLVAENKELAAKVSALEASQKDFDAKVAAKVAEFGIRTGSPGVGPSPKGGSGPGGAMTMTERCLAANGKTAWTK